MPKTYYSRIRTNNSEPLKKLADIDLLIKLHANGLGYTLSGKDLIFELSETEIYVLQNPYTEKESAIIESLTEIIKKVR